MSPSPSYSYHPGPNFLTAPRGDQGNSSCLTLSIKHLVCDSSSLLAFHCHYISSLWLFLLCIMTAASFISNFSRGLRKGHWWGENHQSSSSAPPVWCRWASGRLLLCCNSIQPRLGGGERYESSDVVCCELATGGLGVEVVLSGILTAKHSGEKCEGGGAVGGWGGGWAEKKLYLQISCCFSLFYAPFFYLPFLLLSQSLIFEDFARKPSHYKCLSFIPCKIYCSLI